MPRTTPASPPTGSAGDGAGLEDFSSEVAVVVQGPCTSGSTPAIRARIAGCQQLAAASKAFCSPGPANGLGSLRNAGRLGLAPSPPHHWSWI